LRSGFRKVSRVGSLIGATKWYLSDDCLLAAKHVMYAVEYRRFYLRDLESVVVWPNLLWLLRPIIPGVLLAALALSLGHWVNFTSGAIAGGVGLAWVALELALGPTAKARICTTGATVDLPLVKRARRARKVLAEIDAAVRAVRASVIEQPPAAVSAPRPAAPPAEAKFEAVETKSETPAATARIGDTA
jgi:hypothetical protein